MQIGGFGQTQVYAQQRPEGGAEARVEHGRGHGQGHHHGHDRLRMGEGGSEGRMQARLQRLAAMLQRLTEQNPQAMGASYAAIVTGPGGGALAVAATPNAATPGDALVIQAQSIGDVATGAGNDSLALRASMVQGVYAGGGSDAVAIVASYVSGIRTDGAPPAPAAPGAEVDAPADTTIDTSGAPLPGGNDALSVAARLIADIATGGGDDALALSGRWVSGVDAGAGNDAMAIRARLATDISGGEGDDAIAVEARAGLAGLEAAAAWFAVAAEPPVVALAEGGASAQVGAQAARAYADVDGGAGNDVISVRTGSVLAVAGGAGSDTIQVGGGTVALVYGAGDGDDRVTVAEGAQVVLQIAPEAGPWTVEFGEEGMTVRMADGSVKFEGLGAGTIGIATAGGGMTLVTRPEAGLNRLL